MSDIVNACVEELLYVAEFMRVLDNKCEGESIIWLKDRAERCEQLAERLNKDYMEGKL